MGAPRSTRAAGAPPGTIPPGSLPTAPRRSRATSSGSRATSFWRAARRTRSWSSSEPRASTRVKRRAPRTGGNMADEGRQKDAMDVLQAWVDDYNGRAQPTIRLGSAGEAGGAQLRLKYSPPQGQVAILHMVAGNPDGRAAIPGRPVEGPAAETAVEAGSVGRTRAFRWQERLGIVDLKPLTGVNTSANDINDVGDIVGGGDTGFGDFHAYLLSEGTSVDLGTLGGNESEALAVNRPGQAVGHSRVGGAPAKRAFFIPEPGRMVDLGTLGGATSIAHDVNDRAEVVGFAETPGGQPRAFLWTVGEGMRDLGTLGASASMALAINNHTAIVGGSGHAFLWTEQLGTVDLGTLGGRTSCANDINDAGCIVGVSQTAATDPRGLPVTRAFLRTPDGGMLDLGTLGGEHSSAAAVSEVVDGTVWVAGHSHDAAARIRAVLWAVRLGQDQP